MPRRLNQVVLGSSAILAAAECDTRLERAQSLFRSQEFAAAASALESAVAVCPNRSGVLISLAQVQYLLGDDAASEKNLKAAIDTDPNGVAGRYALGRIYYQQKRYPAAEAEFRQVIRQEPANYRAWDNLALTLDAQQRDREAIEAFVRTLDLIKVDHPDYDWAYANFADFFLRRNQFEKGLSACGRGRATQPAIRAERLSYGQRARETWQGRQKRTLAETGDRVGR